MPLNDNVVKCISVFSRAQSVKISNYSVFYLGAQSGGCRFDKKPLYRYSGCHSYDTSALNIVLGLRHGLNESHYSMKVEISLIIPEESDEDAEKAYRMLNKNTTAFTDNGEVSVGN